jgi:hypothetical protein
MSVGGPDHQYLRLYITNNNGGVGLVLAEMQVKDTPGGSVQIPTSSSASDTYPGYPSTNLHDNNIATWWNSNADSVYPKWASYYWASAKRIAKIDLIVLSTYTTYAPRDISFQVSDNGTDWTTLNTYTNLTWAAYETKTFVM